MISTIAGWIANKETLPARGRAIEAGDVMVLVRRRTGFVDGLVRELMRAMLKEWLDENLRGIVEKHVEAEVQRIARMAG